MNPIRVIGMLLLVISISRASQAQLPCVEAWHHIRDMPMVVYQCMDSCTHVNRVGTATVRSQFTSKDDQLITEAVPSRLFRGVQELPCVTNGRSKRQTLVHFDGV